MGCIKLSILDEQYKRTEIKVSSPQKELTPFFYVVKGRRVLLVNLIDPTGMSAEDPGDGCGNPPTNEKVSIKVTPQDNLQPRPLPPLQQDKPQGGTQQNTPQGTQQKSTLQKIIGKLESLLTGGFWGTADNGQGQETRKGDGNNEKTDLSPLTGNMPEPFGNNNNQNRTPNSPNPEPTTPTPDPMSEKTQSKIINYTVTDRYGDYTTGSIKHDGTKGDSIKVTEGFKNSDKIRKTKTTWK